MPRVEVIIESDGSVKVHVLGVSGPSCIPLTKALEQSLGTVTDVQKTGDFYKQTQTHSEKRTVTH
jgi:Protein of unknown function (DUF2997)